MPHAETGSTAPRRSPGQHRDHPASSPVLPADRRPQPGPIAVLPTSNPRFEQAIVDGGGVVEPLSDRTRGIVWLSYQRAAELETVLESHPDIGWVQLPWAGVDAFAPTLQRFANHPVPLWTSAKGTFSEPVAEHALALTLALLRDLPQKARATRWASVDTGRSLYGRNVVIVGAGGIAIELMRLLSVFEPTITVVRRSAEPVPGAHHTTTPDHLLEVLASADVVVLAAASTDGTRHLIGATELAAMQSTAVLVNIARGALIDTDALVDALRSGSIAGAGLDVTDPEPLPEAHALWAEERCIITSHSADTPDMTGPLLADRIRTNVEALLDHGRFAGVVDTKAGY